MSHVILNFKRRDNVIQLKLVPDNALCPQALSIVTMKLLLQFACLFLTFNLSAEVDWVPQFNDKPVPNERIAAIEKAVPSKPIVPPREARRILVFSATSGYRHASIATSK